MALYGLNIFAWGGVLFFLICNTAAAMCHPACDDHKYWRKISIEIDLPILKCFVLHHGVWADTMEDPGCIYVGPGEVGSERKREATNGLAFNINRKFVHPPAMWVGDNIYVERAGGMGLSGNCALATSLWKLCFVI
jgi:hypothetical protein